jgi:hypothetical protein
MAEINAYGKGSVYSLLLERAFEFDKRLGRPSVTEFENLVDAEKGKSYKWLPSKDKQLDEIKQRLKRAIELLLSQKKYHIDDVILEEQFAEVDNCISSDDIFSVAQKCLNVVLVNE